MEYNLYETAKMNQTYNESYPYIEFEEKDLFDDESKINCTNHYCVSNEDYIDMIRSDMFPSPSLWFLIVMHALVFIVGLVGNALVCIAVYRNHSMRTVTNLFIVNLAVADFFVILVCLPPTVIWDVTTTWFLGDTLCKLIPYVQTVSVAVSVLTLTFISIDRWYAICFPLKFKSTTGRAKTAILLIWFISLLCDIPELIILETKSFEGFEKIHIKSILLTNCTALWTTRDDLVFFIFKALFLYLFPLIFMSVAYCQIVRVLWKSNNIPGQAETTQFFNQSNISKSSSFARATSCSNDGQIRSRRKAAKMLVAVVIMFAVCYLPVHLMSIIRYSIEIPQSDLISAWSMISHWLCYANSAVNPIIYNFMSGKFRKEFERTFGSRWCRSRTNNTFQKSVMRSGATGRHTTFVCRFTNNPATSTQMTTTVAASAARTEILPMSALTGGSHLD